MTNWDTIHNPVTGETITFLERTPERLVLDLHMPRGGLPVISHRHPGTEHFKVKSGVLDLVADGILHRLTEGEEFTVHQEFHHPANTSDADAVATVTFIPGAFAERGLRGIFGLARDGGLRPDGRPRDFLSLALLSEGGQFQIEGLPRPVWIAAMKVLGVVARFAGRRRRLESYWPPELARPW
ncbi:hypothetical protein GCM10023094_56160 [Rhodococcus olei]|uniref:Cupin 2 conserved barrel domain-containing protein n=1 Tax=Rhodococcus olei TaxID=2161675 RepID=A0ABP8PSK1_9NOCA